MLVFYYDSRMGKNNSPTSVNIPDELKQEFRQLAAEVQYFYPDSKVNVSNAVNNVVRLILKVQRHFAEKGTMRKADWLRCFFTSKGTEEITFERLAEATAKAIKELELDV